MKRLIGGLEAKYKSYRLYEEDGKLIDNEGREHSFFGLQSLITMVADGSKFGYSRYLIKKNEDNKIDSKWFCEYVVEYKDGVELFLISYGQTPEEALCNCMELVNQG